jgi:hypothetical protein
VHDGGLRVAHRNSSAILISKFGRPAWGAAVARHHRNIEPADSIRRLGFARWYERRLIEGHAWFITVIMCVIAIAACMEELNFRGSVARLLAYVTFILAAVAIGIYAMVRYRKILTEAEQLGERATCGACGAYARFRLISSTQVRCRKCDNEWCLIDPG